MKRFRGGLAFKAHRLVYHSTLGLRVINKKKEPSRLNTRCHREILAAMGHRSHILAAIDFWRFSLMMLAGDAAFGGWGLGSKGFGLRV